MKKETMQLTTIWMVVLLSLFVAFGCRTKSHTPENVVNKDENGMPLYLSEKEACAFYNAGNATFDSCWEKDSVIAFNIVITSNQDNYLDVCYTYYKNYYKSDTIFRLIRKTYRR